MTTATMDNRFRQPGTRALLWYGILVGPIAFAADQELSYSLVAHACSTGHHYVLYTITAISLLLALSGAAVAAAQLSRTKNATIDGGAPDDRSRFMAILGVSAGLAWATFIIAMAIPRFMLSPCS